MRRREIFLTCWLTALAAFGVKVPILPEPVTHWVDEKQKIAMAHHWEVKHKKHRK